NATPTSSGATPYTPARIEIHSTSAVISSSVSTGAASIASCALELPAHERVEHARERGGEQDRGGHHAGGHVLHVGQVTNVRPQRTEPEPEREQVDDRLHHRGEGGRLPVAAKHHHVTAHHACQRGGLEAVNAAHRGAHGRRAG